MYKSRREKIYDDTDDVEGSESDSEDGGISFKDAKGNMVDLQPHMRFKNYKNLFTKLLNYKSVPTKYPIISMMITYDSEKAITVTKKSDRTYIIKMYCLKNYNITFEEHLGGTRESFIKAKEIEQTNSGKFYACAYFNDGKFRLRTFGRETRS